MRQVVAAFIPWVPETIGRGMYIGWVGEDASGELVAKIGVQRRTALSRARRLIRRMSEYIGLKIVSDEPRTRRELRQLRDNVTSALLQAGFQFDPENAAQRDPGCRPIGRGIDK